MNGALQALYGMGGPARPAPAAERQGRAMGGPPEGAPAQGDLAAGRTGSLGAGGSAAAPAEQPGAAAAAAGAPGEPAAFAPPEVVAAAAQRALAAERAHRAGLARGPGGRRVGTRPRLGRPRRSSAVARRTGRQRGRLGSREQGWRRRSRRCQRRAAAPRAPARQPRTSWGRGARAAPARLGCRATGQRPGDLLSC